MRPDMPVFVSMLRGINLLKYRRVRMDALRALYEAAGLERAQTCVQSGNVVFRTKMRDEKRLTKLIEEAIEREVGFHAAVVLRTTEEMRDAVARNPFAKRKNIEPGKLLVNFMAADPGSQAKKILEAMEIAPEELYVSGREMYIYFPNGQARPNLKWPKVDKILNMAYTGRNWNTTTKLLEMAEELESRGQGTGDRGQKSPTAETKNRKKQEQRTSRERSTDHRNSPESGE